MEKLAGSGAARATSLCVVLSLTSSVIAMTMAGPRVAAAMAAEGFLPRALAGREGRPPVWSVLLQSSLALVLLATNSFEALLRSVGVLLTLVSALTVALVLRLRFGRTPFPRPSPSGGRRGDRLSGRLGLDALVYAQPRIRARCSGWRWWRSRRRSPTAAWRGVGPAV